MLSVPSCGVGTHTAPRGLAMFTHLYTFSYMTTLFLIGITACDIIIREYPSIMITTVTPEENQTHLTNLILPTMLVILVVPRGGRVASLTTDRGNMV